jgi:isopentenyl-diphosphate delta-isomerase type 1
MEHFDILDENGKKTGQVKLRIDVHKDGDWHKAVHVWIINPSGDLLLQRRSTNKETYPNMWDISSAGHISAGDDPISSAIRETEEELGLTLGEDEFEYLFTIKSQRVLHDGKYINNELDDIYLVEDDFDTSILNFNDGEVSEVKWMHYPEYEKHIDEKDPEYVPWSQEYKEKFFAILRERFP